MKKTEYTIIGDHKKYGACLVCLAGYNREHAEQVLYRLLNNPSENDEYLMKGLENFRINEIESDEAWWNDSFMRN